MKKPQIKNANKNNTKKVLVFGTFDGIHPGHIFFLKEAKKMGKLFVSVSSDKNASVLKKKELWKKEDERKKEIKKLKIADKVIIGDEKIGDWNIVGKIKPDIIALGYDQKKMKVALKLVSKKYGFEVRVIKSYKPKIYKSSLIKRDA